MGSQQNELNLHLKVFENTQFPDEFLNTKLINLYCKHMIHTNLNKDSKANRLLAASHKAGYEFCEWGSHEELPSDLLHHLNIITKMEDDDYRHAVRIVICQYCFCERPVIWSDNLHSTIKYIREFGKEACLRDIPFYVIDLTHLEDPVAKGYRDSLNHNISDILGAVSCAFSRYNRSNLKELIDIHYTINDLLNDNIELYTFHNNHLGVIQNGDPARIVIEKSQAINSLYFPKTKKADNEPSKIQFKE